MTPHTNILLSLAAQTGTSGGTGSWYSVPQKNREHFYAAFNFSVGSGTVVLEGRIDANSPTVTILTLSATDTQLVAAMPQVRFRVTAATGLTFVGQVDRPCKVAQ